MFTHGDALRCDEIFIFLLEKKKNGFDNVCNN